VTRSMRNESTIIEPVSGDETVDTAEIMRRAEAAVAALQQCYLATAKADLARLVDAACRLRGPSDDIAQAIHELHRAAHDMKGQGSTFDYPLVTAIGASLCRLVKDRVGADHALDRLVRAHVDALRTVIEQEISGDGPESIRAVVAGLEQSVAEGLPSGPDS
jgi:chemotaxis protein histidine kinase CheA